jgi:hypothetical protein
LLTPEHKEKTMSFKLPKYEDIIKMSKELKDAALLPDFHLALVFTAGAPAGFSSAVLVRIIK